MFGAFFAGFSMGITQCVFWVLTWASEPCFYPRDAMLARVFAIATCPSVCLSVRLSVRRTPVLCLAEQKQDREMYTI